MHSNQAGLFYWAVLVAALIPASAALAADQRFDWLPVEAASAQLRADDVGGERIIPDITLTKTPKPTANLAQFTRTYTIDLKKFGINNDGTNAEQTSIGLNQALQDAKSAGANRIVFPPGRYLISETMPILLDHQSTVIDLNGATLAINPNGLPKYSIVEIIDGAENLRLTNGTLQGDRDSHDFKAAPGTHEWGDCLQFVGGRNLEVDHLTLTGGSGDGAGTGISGTRTRPELLARIKHSIYTKDIESGAFTDQGSKTASAEKTRSIKPFDLAQCEGQFELGYMGGYMGYPFLKGRVYRALFYDGEMKFLEVRKCLQYRKIALPAKARWMHLEFNQPEVSEEPAHVGAVKGGWVARITNFRPPVDVHFHHNRLVNNRRLGLAYCGGQRWLIEDNLFAENGGTNPAYGVDFEDGSELMQDVVFRNNKFQANRNGDLVVCAGSELIFEGNEFEKSVIVWGRPHNYVFRQNQFNGGSVSYATRTGVARIHDNRYQNCKLSIVFDTKGVADGLVRKPGRNVSTPPLALENETLVNMDGISGTYFHLTNCDLQNTSFIAGKDTRLIRLVDCKLAETSIHYEAEGPTIDVTLAANDGQPSEVGPGLNRKQAKQSEVKAGANASGGTWKAGVAKAVITPEKSVWLAGYGSKRPPNGKLHDLWMKALALEDPAGKRVVLITSDFQGVPKVMSDPLFERLKKEHQLERAQVMFTFSHNHCGPRLGDDLVDYYPVEDEQVKLVEEYTAQMIDRAVEMVGEALGKLAPANLAMGEGKATFAVNRRNNREADVPSLIAKGTPLAGPVDHAVPVLTVTRPDGKLAAVLFGYACHPTTLNFFTWCGDYPGFAQLEIEQNHPGATAMFVNTCGGDQNPLPRRSVELCQKYGHLLAVGVEEVLKQPLKPVTPGIQTAFEIVELPYLKVATREELHPLLQDPHPIRARWAARMLGKLDQGEKFASAYPYPIHAWRLGSEMLVIGMGAETVVDYALRFKREFGPGTWVCGYADDMIAYIPSRRVWNEGGYEGGSNLFEYGRPALRWSGEIEDVISVKVHELMKQVRD